MTSFFHSMYAKITMQFRVFDAVHFLLLSIVFPGIVIKLIYGQHDSPNYIGCFYDTVFNRTMEEPVTLHGAIHYTSCLNKCQKDNRFYFGLQFRYQCFCGDSYGHLGELDKNKCNLECRYMPNETCGGTNAMDVFFVATPVNLALGRQTWQSSTFFVNNKNYSSSMAVDGNKTTFMHTHTEIKPWWAVDLGNRTRVRKIILTNREDGCGERINNFIVALSNTPPADNRQTRNSYTVCGRGPERALTGERIPVHCNNTMVSTRYVIIQLPTPAGCLHFSELEVYGEVSDACGINNGGCSHSCLYTDDGRRCACDTGYTLNSDGSNCTDINECDEPGNGYCSHFCANLPGSHVCSCQKGFNLADDNITCIDLDECKVDNGGCSEVCYNVEGSFSCLYSDNGLRTGPTGLMPVVITLIILLVASAVVNIFLIVKLKHKTSTSANNVAARDYQALQKTMSQLAARSGDGNSAETYEQINCVSPNEMLYETVGPGD